MDVSATLAPKSDQLDAVELLSGPRIFTITGVDVRNGAEQPVSVHLAEFDRVWRPGLSMRRVLAYIYGNDSSGWVGHKVELYCDERVKFGNETVGGTRISRMTGIDKARSIPLPVSKAKVSMFKVAPLSPADIIEALKAEWRAADPDRRKAIESEVAALQGNDQPAPTEAADLPGADQ